MSVSDPANELARIRSALAGQFRIDRELGRGGMGIVYLAHDLRLDRAVAIKLLPEQLGRVPELRDRFIREARTAAQLSHPNIVPIFRADEADGIAWFVMGFIAGETLAEHVAARGPIPPAEAVRYLTDAAWALAYAHARGIVHRDIKPENIIVEHGSGRAMVTDFGIARREHDARLTQDGHVLGSVHFMSPEQVLGEALDGRSDLYALGAVGYYILSGRLPFHDLPASAVLVAHTSRPAPPLRTVSPAVPPALAAVIDRCLAKDAAARFESGEALAEGLAQALAARDADSVVTSRVLSSDEAGAVWRRAAQLQLDAAQQLEERSAGSALASALREADALAPSGYRVRDVEAAAVEAGISRQHVALALAELAAQGLDPVAPLAPWKERLALSVLRSPARSLSASRTMRAAPKAVLSAVGQILQAYPFSLVLRDTVGGHPLDGGLIVFDLPTPSAGQLSGGTYNWMYTRYNCYATQLRASLRRAAEAGEMTELTLSIDVQAGWGKNLRETAWITGVVGAMGGAGGAALGINALAISGIALALPIAAGLAIGGGLIMAGMGPVYRWGLRKVKAELEAALSAIEGSVKSQDLFGAGPPPPPPLPSGGGNGGDFVVMVS